MFSGFFSASSPGSFKGQGLCLVHYRFAQSRHSANIVMDKKGINRSHICPKTNNRHVPRILVTGFRFTHTTNSLEASFSNSLPPFLPRPPPSPPSSPPPTLSYITVVPHFSPCTAPQQAPKSSPSPRLAPQAPSPFALCPHWHYYFSSTLALHTFWVLHFFSASSLPYYPSLISRPRSSLGRAESSLLVSLKMRPSGQRQKKRCSPWREGEGEGWHAEERWRKTKMSPFPPSQWHSDR